MEESERDVRNQTSPARLTQEASLSPREKENTGEKDETNTDADKKLDISSDQFDPLLALYSSKVHLPYPNVKCFNNLAEYESFMKGGRGRAKPENVEKKMRKARRGVPDPERIERLKQLMVRNPLEDGEESGVKRRVKQRAPKNVLTRMPLHEGSPLGELNRCVQHHLRVKVHIRSFKGLRGVCAGFVVAFDKFWNLAMADVDETYREPLLGESFYHEKALTVTRLFQKLQVQAASVNATEMETSRADVLSAQLHHISSSNIARIRASGQTTESVTHCVKKLEVIHKNTPHVHDSKSEWRPKMEYGCVHTRHVNQLFIRGENVLLVNIQHD